MTEQSLRNWVKRDQLERRERDDGLTVAERDELRELRRKGRRLEQERDLLKRAAAFFARETRSTCFPRLASRSSTPPASRAGARKRQNVNGVLKTLRVSNTTNDYHNDNK